MLSASGPANMPGKSVRMSISIGRATAVPARPAASRPAIWIEASSLIRPCRPGRAPPPPVGRRGPIVGVSVVAAQPESFAVDHDLAARRREDADDRPDERYVQLAGRAAHHHDLGAAGAVDVDDLTERVPSTSATFAPMTSCQ
jgi:hypothetical protein